MKYKFISFEGIEGSGKSTQAKLLSENLQKLGHKTTLTREPGGAKASEAIRKILLSEEWPSLEGKTEILLNFSARIEHIEKLIKPAIAQGEIVISDRFFDSTLAYQGYGFGAELDLIKKVNELAIGNFSPDITFLIDAPVETTFERIKDRKSNNRYEKLGIDFHKKTRNGFLEIAQNNPRIKIIDGTKSVAEISEEILSYLF